MKKNKIVLLALCIASHYYWAQDKDYVQGIVPQTPEVNALFKNFETPVSLNTGVPNISIPIYTIKEGDIDFNLSLSYNSSGITVGERSTWVGLGWNLPISTLARNVRQVPDDLSYGFFYEQQYTVKNVYAIRNAQTPDQQTICDEICIKHQQGILDLESDDYRLTLPDGKSISFMVNQERSTENPIGQIVQFPESDYKIKYNQTTGSWIVTNPLGYQYVYEKGSTIYFSHTYSIGDGFIGTPPTGGTNSYNNTWILSKIISPTNRVLNFEYDPINYDDCDLVNQTKTVVSEGGNNSRNEVTTNYGKTKGTNTFIKRIYGDFGEVIFNKSERLDYATYGRKLDNIEVKNNNRVINKIELQYDYMTSTVPSPVYSCNRYEPNDNIAKRLRLNKVIFDANTIKPYSYQLQYNSQLLPHRFSYARDWWGYYNGQMNNQGLTPSIDLVLEEQNKRDVDQESTKAGILEEIVYPTGGKTKFIFENNRGIDNINSAGRGNEFHNITPYKIQYKHFSTNENTSQQLNKTYTSPIAINISDLTGFQNVNLQIDGQTTKCIYEDGNLPERGSCAIYYSVLNGNNEVIVPRLLLRNLSKMAQIPINKLTPANNTLKVEVYSGTQSSLPGMQYFNYNQDEATVSLRWKELDNILTKKTDAGFEVPFGGLRIKKIENYSSANTLSLVKEYAYKSDAGIESGISNFEMDFLQYGKNKIFVASQSRFPMQNNSSTAIQYVRADEIQTNFQTNEQIKVSHYFQNNNRLGAFLGSCLFIKPMGEAHLASATVPCYEHPLNSKEVGTISNVFTEEKYQYSSNFPTGVEEQKKPKRIYGIDYDRVLKPQDFTYLKYNLGFLFSSSYLGFQFFYYEFNNFEELPKEFTNTRTEILDGTNLVTKTQYKSLSPNHYQVTKEKTSLPDGIIKETNYSYAYEKNNQKLINANMIGIPLETETTQTIGVATQSLSKTETKYDHPSNLLPTSVLSYDFQNNPSTEVTYDQYDSKGNLQQYTAKNGISTVIVWGYNQTKPIAKIEGAKLTDIQQSLIDAIVAASNTDASAAPNNDETAFLSALNTFRMNASLSAYQVTTYTYDPLIGVRSITPSSGIRENYIYDSAGRLEKVMNADGKVLKEMKYNYKN
ncbi:hypothetical protein JOE44_000207 [Chryseobacterium sp. PvR013]|uniref:hypothetical protein n=1 Tax=Chryseobacterium sp. PvR013 TaxID=2806595 RepID=UPI001AEB625F|nr:hypothetical protein [Chryseobacterium sp. PvR013]MBP1163323.1 hypothetical protein [Chryseobacterium sp. PvR013]